MLPVFDGGRISLVLFGQYEPYEFRVGHFALFLRTSSSYGAAEDPIDHTSAYRC